MNFVVLFPYYIYWHYGRALSDMLELWKHILMFIYRFFSIHTLLFSLFSPWQKMNEGYVKGVHPAEFFNTLVVNTIMRIIGAVVRCVVILFGIVTLGTSIFLVILASIVWILLPMILIGLFVFSIKQLLF